MVRTDPNSFFKTLKMKQKFPNLKFVGSATTAEEQAHILRGGNPNRSYVDMNSVFDKFGEQISSDVRVRVSDFFEYPEDDSTR